MSAKILGTEKNVCTLELTISPEDFSKALDQSYRKNKKYFSVQGFRKGKAPRKIIEARYGKGIFVEDAIDFAFPDAYKEALKETEIQAVTRPELEKVDKCSEEEGAVFVVKVGLLPEVSLGEYTGAEISVLDPVIEEEDIAKRLKEMADRNARIVTEEEAPAEMGDIVMINYEGFVDDVPFEGGKDENSRLELGSGMFIPGFEEQLVGAKKGDDVEVKVTFPEEYHAVNLQGKEAIFKVHINDHFKKVVPPMDDDFAKDVSEFDTLDELKADIKEKLYKEFKETRRAEAEQAVVDFAIEHVEMEIPEMMTAEEADRSYSTAERQMTAQGIKMDDYLTYTGKTVEEFKKELYPEAEKNIKIEMTLAKIAETEKLEASEEDLDAEIKIYSDTLKKDFEEYKAGVMEDDRFREYLEANIKRRKTIDFLIEKAIQK